MVVGPVLESCAAIYALSIVVELVRTRRGGRFLLQLLILVAASVLSVLVSSAKSGVVSFGTGASTVWVIVIMFFTTLLGIGARYVFYLRGAFSWLDFLKPLCISPIILLPLIGSVQGMTELAPMQIVSFGLLGFQNGFFWEIVLERAKPNP
jgi:hypothetical protein